MKMHNNTFQSPEGYRYPVDAKTRNKQKLSVEIRSSSGHPFGAPLEISRISLLYRGAILTECVIPSGHETYLQHYQTIHPVDYTPLMVSILTHGIIFLNGRVSFTLPHQHLDIKELSLRIQYRSKKAAKADVVVIQHQQQYYFGELLVSKTCCWEECFLSIKDNKPIPTSDHCNTNEEVIVDNITCINKYDDPTSTVFINEKVSLVIDYTVTNKNFFQQLQLVTVIKENVTKRVYLMPIQELRFNPFSPTGKLVMPIATPLPPGEYTVALLLMKKGQRNKMESTPLLTLNPDKDGYHLKKHTLTFTVIEPIIEEKQHTLYSVKNKEQDVVAYN